MNNTLDIVNLVENNPLIKFDNTDYQSRLVDKLRSKFSTDEQHIFLASFYSYLNYNPNDFVINLDDIWKWLGFSQKVRAKELLSKEFTADKDYKLAFSPEKASLHGGHNHEDIFLTVKCFKKLCLKARTKKADEIHDYYLALEEVTHELVEEESEALRKRLTLNANKNLLTNFHKKQVVYFGFTEFNKYMCGVVGKFGCSDDPERRLNEHQKEIKSDFKFEYIYQSQYSREIERRIKSHPEVIKRRITKEYNGKKQTELIQFDSVFTIYSLDNIIRDIKKEVETEETDKDKNAIISKLKEEISELENDKDKIINLQQDSMQNLNIRLQEIKTAVYLNFLIDFVAKHINEPIVNLTPDEIFEQYKSFRIATHFQDAIHNEEYEKGCISKVFNDIPGIKITKNSKEFHIDIISKWICQNVTIPKRFRTIFRNLSKKTNNEDVNTSRQPDLVVKTNDVKLPPGIDLRNGRYMVRVGCNKKREYLGQFDTLDEALKVYCNRKKEQNTEGGIRKIKDKYYARVTYQQKEYSLGGFSSIDKAKKVRNEAKEQIYLNTFNKK